MKTVLEHFAKLLEAQPNIYADFVDLIKAEIQPKGKNTKYDSSVFPEVMTYVIALVDDVEERGGNSPHTILRRQFEYMKYKQQRYTAAYFGWYCSLPNTSDNSTGSDRPALAKNIYNRVLAVTETSKVPEELKKWSSDWAPPWVGALVYPKLESLHDVDLWLKDTEPKGSQRETSIAKNKALSGGSSSSTYVPPAITQVTQSYDESFVSIEVFTREFEDATSLEVNGVFGKKALWKFPTISHGLINANVGLSGAWLELNISPDCEVNAKFLGNSTERIGELIISGFHRNRLEGDGSLTLIWRVECVPDPITNLNPQRFCETVSSGNSNIRFSVKADPLDLRVNVAFEELYGPDNGLLEIKNEIANFIVEDAVQKLAKDKNVFRAPLSVTQIEP